MNYQLISESPLFAGCSEEETKEILSVLSCYVKAYDEGEILLHAGEPVTEVGLVLSGRVHIEMVDILGNCSILGTAGPRDLFAESYACLPNQPLIVDVIADEDCEVLFIRTAEFFRRAESAQVERAAGILTANLLRIAAQKNYRLSMRICHSAPKTIRARLYSYFSEQIKEQGHREIDIDLDRRQLADYLGVERTALSKELGKMREEGLLGFRKNHFVIKESGED